MSALTIPHRLFPSAAPLVRAGLTARPTAFVGSFWKFSPTDSQTSQPLDPETTEGRNRTSDVVEANGRPKPWAEK